MTALLSVAAFVVSMLQARQNMKEESSDWLHRPEFDKKLKYWEQLRNAIVHEDNLVNHRLTWLLTTEGFLLTGFFIIQAAILSNKLPWQAVLVLESMLCVVFFGAALICLTTRLTIATAYRQIHFIKRMWLYKFKNEDRFPGYIDCFKPPEWRLVSGDDNPQEEDVKKLTGSDLEEAKQPDFPPISGGFKFPPVLNTENIPGILCLVNSLALIVSLAIGVVMCFQKEGQKTLVELEVDSKYGKVKAVVEMNKLTELDSALKALTSAIPTPQPLPTPTEQPNLKNQTSPQVQIVPPPSPAQNRNRTSNSSQIKGSGDDSVVP
jgi:hypothetical protein